MTVCLLIDSEDLNQVCGGDQKTIKFFTKMIELTDITEDMRFYDRCYSVSKSIKMAPRQIAFDIYNIFNTAFTAYMDAGILGVDPKSITAQTVIAGGANTIDRMSNIYGLSFLNSFWADKFYIFREILPAIQFACNAYTPENNRVDFMSTIPTEMPLEWRYPNYTIAAASYDPVAATNGSEPIHCYTASAII